jgi:hypothetical protein
MNIKNILIGAGLVGLLTMPVACSKEESQFERNLVTNNPNQNTQEQNPAEREHYYSFNGHYKIPLEVSSIPFAGPINKKDNLALIVGNSLVGQWSRQVIPPNESIKLPNTQDRFYKIYGDGTNINILINSFEASGLNSEEYVDLLNKSLINIFENKIKKGYKEKLESKTKLDGQEARKTYYNNANNTSKEYNATICTIHKKRVYFLMFNSNNGKDPEKSFEKIEKGFKFLD